MDFFKKLNLRKTKTFRLSNYLKGYFVDWNKVLFTATQEGNLTLLRKAVKKGADVNAVNRYGETPLHIASFNNNTELARVLIKKGANVKKENIVDGYRKTPLHSAAENGNIELSLALLETGADVNALDVYRKTPLHYAVENGYAKLSLIFLKAGANVNALDVCPNTSFQYETNNYKISEISTSSEGSKEVHKKEEIKKPIHSKEKFKSDSSQVVDYDSNNKIQADKLFSFRKAINLSLNKSYTLEEFYSDSETYRIREMRIKRLRNQHLHRELGKSSVHYNQKR